ncbi:hypothetical protein H1R82_07325 [Thermoactinomyces intermedius]|jgi:hypothetical protein|uniref:Head-tail adaptor protein n=2 Tax=Thermoactinomyces TaxID=2023 RepID=A0A8I1AB17_THEIN|nr:MULTISPECIES: hypothetical protein [Thermoactinomyces]MBA4547687.1 hypothetical protein [Thermoactinomyces intermedius]MBA4552565.1 hypothetical protein [Thermoactinomyces vulgaris]MBA4836439.1 hypothetical protein [Thermoactinomyces intermedius]MBH8589711.1 hypothetical protein [Thermoactinomyces vulgaris]MBH8594084.1 hypothetical protein [Thermoactinomyces intermedius]
MAWIPMKDKIKITKLEGIDGWGEPIWGESREVKGRISEQTRIVLNQNGEEVSSRYTLYVSPKEVIRYGDKIEFTDSSGLTISGEPLSIKAIKDYGGKVILRKVSLR